MLKEYYDCFISQCLTHLEANEDYRDKLTKLKSITTHKYIDIMGQAILDYCGKYYIDGEFDEYNKDMEYMIDTLVYQYEKMCMTYIFDVTVEGYEKQIKRTIQVPWNATLGNLACVIIASFDGENLSFNIAHGEDDLDDFYVSEKGDKYFESAFDTEIAYMNFKNNSYMTMTLSVYKINIHFCEIRNMENIHVNQQYKIIEAKGEKLYFGSDVFDIYEVGKKEKIQNIISNCVSKEYIPIDLEDKMFFLYALYDFKTDDDGYDEIELWED